MSPIWVVPVIVLLVGSAAVVALLKATSESARELGTEIARFGELHAALARVRTELQQTSGTVREIRATQYRR